MLVWGEGVLVRRVLKELVIKGLVSIIPFGPCDIDRLPVRSLFPCSAHLFIFRPRS